MVQSQKGKVGKILKNNFVESATGQQISSDVPQQHTIQSKQDPNNKTMLNSNNSSIHQNPLQMILKTQQYQPSKAINLPTS